MVVAVEIRQEHITLEAPREGSRTGHFLPGKVDAADSPVNGRSASVARLPAVSRRPRVDRLT
jgi:hypothetical protein